MLLVNSDHALLGRAVEVGAFEGEIARKLSI
jgi:hypothetical protein